ncbi:MAG: PaaI family thioesterase [Desulfobacteraceae bacterium]|jgi:uncharacterized protein (TIGR00369 family)
MEITKELLDQMNDNGVYETMGIRIEKANDGKAHSHLRPAPELCWPFPGQPHGGVLFTLMDATMAWAVLSQVDSGQNCATISTDIQYTNPARGDRFTCVAWTTHRTGRLGFVRAEISDAKGQLVAMGQATFRIMNMDLVRA